MSSGQPRSGAGRFIIIMDTLLTHHIAYSEASRVAVGVFMSVTQLNYRSMTKSSPRDTRWGRTTSLVGEYRLGELLWPLSPLQALVLFVTQLNYRCK